ncbi:MAG: hypothetical protein M3Z49_02125 [Bifidobacteriales bacterium]|nr:hypothetical protein [Bifidobacteriales bacterium]
MSNSISISHLDIETMYPLAELLGEDGHFLITPEDIPLKVTIIGAETWVEYGKCQKVDTQKLFAALSKGQVSDARDE